MITLQEIDFAILCYTANDPLGGTIQTVTRGSICHVAAFIRTGTGQYQGNVYEALFDKGVIRRGLKTEDVLGKRCHWLVPNLHFIKHPRDSVAGWNLAMDRAAAFAEAQLGKGYDWPSIVGFIRKGTRQGRKSLGLWFCSELVSAICEAADACLLPCACEHHLQSPRDTWTTTRYARVAWKVAPSGEVQGELYLPDADPLRGTRSNRMEVA